MSDVNCPYCDAEIEINHDDGYGYEEDETFQQYCSVCDKYFTFTTSIHFYYDVQKAPCLNGGEHNWKSMKSYSLSNGKEKFYCTYCDGRKIG